MAASAPGKLILFGEHAVVFGEPALATAINLRAEVYARPHPEWRADGGSIDEPRYRYVKAAIAKVATVGPLWVEVRSMVPSGAGLGSSAAVTVATLGTLHGMGGSIDAKTIAREAFEVEHEVQGRASPIDTSTASAGGGLLVLPKPQGDLLWTIERDARRWCLHRTNLPPLDFVIGNTGISAATGPLVANVKERVGHDRKAAEAVRRRVGPEGGGALYMRRPHPQKPRGPGDDGWAGPSPLLIVHAAELITLKGPPGPRRHGMADDLGLVEDGAVYAEGERIVDVGPTATVLGRHPHASMTIDATGQTVLPGFVDAHTHAVFAGSREHEIEWKAQGMGYREIAARGGGILHTVRATREAREEDLARAATDRFRSMLAFGTTTIEVKSGYGLRTEDELKILRASARKSMRTNSRTPAVRFSRRKSARHRRTTFFMRPRMESMPSHGPRSSGSCSPRRRWSPISRSRTVGASLRPAFRSPSGPTSTRKPGASPRSSRSRWRATTMAFSRRRPSSPRRSTRPTRSAWEPRSAAWSPGSSRTSSSSGSRRTVTSDTGLVGTRSGLSSSEARSRSAVQFDRRHPSFGGGRFFGATRIPERRTLNDRTDVARSDGGIEGRCVSRGAPGVRAQGVSGHARQPRRDCPPPNGR